MATKTEAEAGSKPSLRERFSSVNAGSQFKTGAGSVAGILAKIVMVIAGIAALILVLHIVFTIFNGNPTNSIVSDVKDWSDSLAGKLSSLFSFKNMKLAVLVNYGIAAIVWFGGGSLVAGLLRRIQT